ncbi:hypothetical protein [Halomarina oriensis]|uniref:Uncharacterized protein n=1 Tax=Halomarina oriensis TaxID=671145 RepID=A0A6B0GUC6_9EURY|nr:hypothetical protein [Halomarina oriensis]MWG35735.1 hypothetical protein [Halomarina oriensis]
MVSHAHTTPEPSTTRNVLGLAALAAVQTRGRRFAAYGAALLAVTLPVASVFDPITSGLPTTWSALSVLWGLALVGACEWRTAWDVRAQPRSTEEAHATD